MVARRLLRRLGSADVAALITVPPACALTFLEAYMRTDVADADLPHKCQYSPIAGCLRSTQVRQLEQNGFVVLEGASAPISGCLLRQAREGAMAVQQEEKRFALSTNDADVRQDHLCWLRETDGMPAAPVQDRQWAPLDKALVHCMRLLRGVAWALECHQYTCSHQHQVPQQVQLAWYPGNGHSHYVRHLDSCVDPAYEIGLMAWLRVSDYRRRSVTAILYLNDDAWNLAQDGGGLRLYLDKGSVGQHEAHTDANGESYVDVIPRGGTLVLFDSRRIEHEVLPTNKDRLALTCWILGEQTAS